MDIKNIENRNIINLCPHEITIYGGAVYDPACKKYRGGHAIMRIPASGQVATAYSSVRAAEPMMLNGVWVPTCRMVYTDVTELPEEGEMFIVSSKYAKASKELDKDMGKILTTMGVVVDESGKQVGCTTLVRYDEYLENCEPDAA